ncbi:MAG: HAD family phosphatase [Chitinophagales bacterium]|nr:HAD family phosphatase [Chitinophagales bacterium]
MIRNIIFDYGGVIIDIDYEKTITEFVKLGVTNFDSHFSQLRQSQLFDLLDKGMIREKEFRDGLREQTGLQLTDEQIDSAWNAMIIGIGEDKMHFLSELYAANYKCYLLSNTNFIHIKHITKYLLKTHGRFNIDSFFNKVYYSCVIQMRKPEIEIFKKVMNDNDLKPEETLFIDDSAQHVETAKSLGIQTILFDTKSDLRNVMLPFLNLTQP